MAAGGGPSMVTGSNSNQAWSLAYCGFVGSERFALVDHGHITSDKIENSYFQQDAGGLLETDSI